MARGYSSTGENIIPAGPEYFISFVSTEVSEMSDSNSDLEQTAHTLPDYMTSGCIAIVRNLSAHTETDRNTRRKIANCRQHVLLAAAHR